LSDPTESIRRKTVSQINQLQDGELPTPHWTSEEFVQEFTVLGFLAPYVHVIRKSDGVEGSIMFRHNPRIYFGFKAV
jgi:hypothetical protein